ncbi:MAG: MSMEG_0567/Sll0786 family nitrogen starvation N-acetyltransferase [Solirubrobacteraceae bacterium]
MSEPIVAPRPAERATGVECRLVGSADELASHFDVRRRVFVDEQAIFAGDDRDERDEDPATLFVIGLVDGVVCGAVRLYPLDDRGLWKGDRLAVLPDQRSSLLGARLVRFAVRTGGERGGTRMVANIQVPNLRFFEWLGWARDGGEHDFHGVRHVPVTIELTPPRGR